MDQFCPPQKHIGVTLGDPCGIGPEVVVKALSDPFFRTLAHFKIIGDYTTYTRYASYLPENCSFIEVPLPKRKNIHPGKPNYLSARASLSYLEKAIELLQNKEIYALVTAPVCKKAVAEDYPSFQGHTEFLADAFKIKKVGMLFVTDKLRVSLVTRHIPLNKVSQAITSSLVYHTIELTHLALKNLFKIQRPVIGICGLNPHAGEGGTIGKEELFKILPALKKARKKSMDVRGPFAADTLFVPKNAKPFDAIIAMYHDQGLIPVKTLFFRDVVNLTIGLPFIRTSPAHGTAFDIAGKNKADASSMKEALRLAASLSPSPHEKNHS